MTTCGMMIACWDHMRRPCMRHVGHENGCNPFSNSEPIAGIVTREKDISEMFDDMLEAAEIGK